MTNDEIRTSRADVPQAGAELHGDTIVLRSVAPGDVPELGRGITRICHKAKQECIRKHTCEKSPR